jgi:hypothetical protein
MEGGHGEKLSRKQELAIAAMLASDTLAAAASKCGLNVNTLVKWRKEPGFKAAYAAACREVLSDAVGQLQVASVHAVEALRKKLMSKQDAVAVSAAKAILEITLKATDQLEILNRVKAIEEWMKNAGAAGAINRLGPRI